MSKGQVLSKWTNFDWLQANDGTSVGVSPSGTGRIRYNNTTKKFESSVDGASYVLLGGVNGSAAAHQVAVYNTASTVAGSPNLTIDGNGRFVASGDLGQVRTDGAFGATEGVGLQALGSRNIALLLSTNDGSSIVAIKNSSGAVVHNFASNGNAFIGGIATAVRFSASIGQSGGYAYLCNNNTTMNTYETSGTQVIWCYPRYLDNALYLDGGSGGTYIRGGNGAVIGMAVHPAGYMTVGAGQQTSYRCQVSGSPNGNWAFNVNAGPQFYACHPAGYGMHVNTGSADNAGLYIAQFYNGVAHAMTIRGDRVIEIGDPDGFAYLNGGAFNINNRPVMIGNCTSFMVFSSSPSFAQFYAAGDNFAGGSAVRIVTDSQNGNGVMQFLTCYTDINGNEGGPTLRIYLQSDGGIVGGYKSFEIPHPIPALHETKILRHVSVEGPRADLIYRGKARLSNGTISTNVDTTNKMTDGTLVLLAKNFQVFVTNNDSFTPIKGALVGNILTITASNNACNDEIDWMVVAERIDKTMMDSDRTDDSGSIIVEQNKSEVHAPISPMPRHNL